MEMVISTARRSDLGQPGRIPDGLLLEKGEVTEKTKRSTYERTGDDIT